MLRDVSTIIVLVLCTIVSVIGLKQDECEGMITFEDIEIMEY